MLSSKTHAKNKSLLLTPVTKEGVTAGPAESFGKLLDEPVRYSWAAFIVFFFLAAAIFIAAGRTLV